MYRSSVFRMIRPVALSWFVSAASVFLLSWCLYVMEWEAAGSEMAVRLVYFVSCLAGGFLAGREFRERRLLWGIFCGILYALILLTVSQLTGGLGSSSIPEIAVIFAICAGGGAAGSFFS
ncbi:MAG: TIGR04086 family membrane protein [Lachnospiraceae bacterium]